MTDNECPPRTRGRVAGYRWHGDHGVASCPECRAAWRTYMRLYRKARKARARSSALLDGPR